ncbi:MAG: Fe-Mn family superoxide dismutase [Planctomycetota bacterium]|jgi:Fe-Mn family superoxide dismutase
MANPLLAATTHELPTLPFSMDGLQPHISAETLEYHHGKHHNAYVTNLNKLIAGTEFAGKSLGDIITSSSGGVFNNAAQHFNHSFYWQGIEPGGASAPSGDLATAINAAFGSFDKFMEDFKGKCATNFGSGWTWLVKGTDGALSIVQTSNAACPVTEGLTPVMVCDVWEHAYYVDYRNARPKYVEAFCQLINWDRAATAFAG